MLAENLLNSEEDLLQYDVKDMCVLGNEITFKKEFHRGAEKKKKENIEMRKYEKFQRNTQNINNRKIYIYIFILIEYFLSRVYDNGKLSNKTY